MNVKFKKDYLRMTGRNYKFNIIFLINILIYHNIRYMFWWRSYKIKPSKIKRLILLKYSRKYGLEISPSAHIDDELYLGHPYNITVGGDVKLGKHVSLHKGCTIGRENRGKREGVPVISDNVYIGINSTVVGNIKIGNDVMICPNTFVNFDVPPHSVVIGNPGIIHHKDNATEKYL